MKRNPFPLTYDDVFTIPLTAHEKDYAVKHKLRAAWAYGSEVAFLGHLWWWLVQGWKLKVRNGARPVLLSERSCCHNPTIAREKRP